MSACRCQAHVFDRLSQIIDKKFRYICLSVGVGLKFVTDKVELSVKKLRGVVGLLQMTDRSSICMQGERAIRELD